MIALFLATPWQYRADSPRAGRELACYPSRFHATNCIPMPQETHHTGSEDSRTDPNIPESNAGDEGGPHGREARAASPATTGSSAGRDPDYGPESESADSESDDEEARSLVQERANTDVAFSRAQLLDSRTRTPTPARGRVENAGQGAPRPQTSTGGRRHSGRKSLSSARNWRPLGAR